MNNKDIILFDLITGTPPYFGVKFGIMTLINEEYKQPQYDNNSILDTNHNTDDVTIMNNNNIIMNMNASNPMIK